MGGMTQAAVFSGGRMLKQIGPALFRVALVTGVVQRRFYQGELGARAMAVVTVATGCATFFDRMTRRQIGLGALAGVTLIAGICLGALVQYRVVLNMHLVAAGAGQIFIIVHTAGPQYLFSAAVTVGAAGDLFLGSGWPPRAITDARGYFERFAAVTIAVTMTTDTTAITALTDAPMTGLQDGVDRMIGTGGVTTKAVCDLLSSDHHGSYRPEQACCQGQYQ